MKKKVNIQMELRLYILKTHKTQVKAAAWWAMSPGYLSEILAGKRDPTAAMLRDAGFVRVEKPAQISYVKA